MRRVHTHRGRRGNVPAEFMYAARERVVVLCVWAVLVVFGV
jgi:hypothetical protein